MPTPLHLWLFGEGEERNHRVCGNRGGSVQRFTAEVLCNPMLNSASDLLGSRVKPVCFSCLYFCCTPQKMMIAHGFSRYLSLKAQCTRLLGGVTSSSRQLTPSKDADVWRGNAYERKTGKGGGEVWDRAGGMVGWGRRWWLRALKGTGGGVGKWR